MIGIIDYGLGNLKAFANIYKSLNIPFVIASRAKDLENVSRVILPGVGAFDHAMKRLQDSGMRECLDEIVLKRKLPVIGICVGMQILTRLSEEGSSSGLGWIDGETKKFDFSSLPEPMSIPHMGWNNLNPVKDDGLIRGLSTDSRFYFLHSYYVYCNNPENILAITNYGGQFTCAIKHDNIYGVQFHPEKSHRDGIQLLKNFSEL